MLRTYRRWLIYEPLALVARLRALAFLPATDVDVFLQSLPFPSRLFVPGCDLWSIVSIGDG
jgi:hypothetical protein